MAAIAPISIFQGVGPKGRDVLEAVMLAHRGDTGAKAILSPISIRRPLADTAQATWTL